MTGASSGIGLELARQFAQHGFDPLIAAENDKIIEAARSLQTNGTSVQAVKTDLASYEGVEPVKAGPSKVLLRERLLH